MIKLILICLAVAGLYYISYTHGYGIGYSDGKEIADTEWTHRKMTYAGNLVDVKTGKETTIPCYHVEKIGEDEC